MLFVDLVDPVRRRARLEGSADQPAIEAGQDGLQIAGQKPVVRLEAVREPHRDGVVRPRFNRVTQKSIEASISTLATSPTRKVDVFGSVRICRWNPGLGSPFSIATSAVRSTR